MHTLYFALLSVLGFLIVFYLAVKIVTFSTLMRGKVRFIKDIKSFLLKSGSPKKLGSRIYSKYPHFIKKYLEKVSAFNAKKLIKYAKIKFIGHRKEDMAKEWKPVSGTSYICGLFPSIFWNAGMHLNGLLPVNAFKSFINGRGNINIKFYSLIRAAYSDGVKVDKNLFDLWSVYLPFVPTLFLAKKDIVWEVLPDRKVKALFKIGELSSDVLISFNDFNEISSIETTKLLVSDKSFKETKALITYDGYEDFKGVLIPTQMEVLNISGDKKQEIASYFIKEVVLKF